MFYLSIPHEPLPRDGQGLQYDQLPFPLGNVKSSCIAVCTVYCVRNTMEHIEPLRRTSITGTSAFAPDSESEDLT